MSWNTRATRVKVAAIALLCAFSAPSMAKLVIGVDDNHHCVIIDFHGPGSHPTFVDLGVLPFGACGWLSDLLT